MELKRFFLEQLEREVVASRKAIERVPEGRSSWKPHEKSMELGKLASLVATMPGWVALMIDRDGLDLNSGGESFRTKPAETRAELLAALDKAHAEGRRALEGATEDPRYAAIADGALAHLAHHRGQLTVYLRLLESKVPAIYGPSADEWN
jgi:hypothetical protein